MTFYIQFQWCMVTFRLAKEIQKGTPSCPAKAKKMGLKANNMSAPFKQVYILLHAEVAFVIWIKYKILSGMYTHRRFDNMAVIRAFRGALTSALLNHNASVKLLWDYLLKYFSSASA